MVFFWERRADGSLEVCFCELSAAAPQRGKPSPKDQEQSLSESVHDPTAGLQGPPRVRGAIWGAQKHSWVENNHSSGSFSSLLYCLLFVRKYLDLEIVKIMLTQSKSQTVETTGPLFPRGVPGYQSNLINISITFYRSFFFISISPASPTVPKVQGPCYSSLKRWKKVKSLSRVRLFATP